MRVSITKTHQDLQKEQKRIDKTKHFIKKKKNINKLEIQSMKSTTKYQLLFNIMKAMMN